MNTSNVQLPPPPPPQGDIRAYVRRLYDWLSRNQVQPGAGIRATRTSNGWRFGTGAADSAAGFPCPYGITIVDGGSGDDTVTIRYGSLNGDVLTPAATGETIFGGVPTIGGTAIGSSPAPELALSGAGTSVIVLKVTTDPEGLIKTGVIESHDSASLPTDTEHDFVGDTDGTYYLEIGRVDVATDGTASNPRNAFCGSVTFRACGGGKVEYLIAGTVDPSEETA